MVTGGTAGGSLKGKGVMDMGICGQSQISLYKGIGVISRRSMEVV